MHPELVRIGPIALYSYGLLVVLGFLAAVWWTSRHSEREGITPAQVMDAGVAILLSGLVAARIVFVLLDPRDFRHWTDVLRVWEGGLSLHGGLVGAVLAGLWYCRRHGIPFLKLADLAAPGAALGYAIGRVGCLLRGCCYGQPCDLPWALRFPDELVPGRLTPPSHPTMVYASAAGLLIFAFLAWLTPRRRYRGQVFGAFLALYALYRFVVEFYRKGVTARVAFAGLTEAQVASVVLLIAAAALLWWRRSAEGETRREGGKAEGVRG